MAPQEVFPRFYGPFRNDDEINRAIDEIAHNPDWTVIWHEREPGWISFDLVHRSGGPPLEVRQERTADGSWYSRE